ncbi:MULTISPECIES: hypothetical protein, partial [unclassified Microcoleus]|uniref:hypothetical protein n=1 Tax=unclassified Microcoleus TaxID=2642155 RepID=UPI0025FC72F3
MPISPSAVHFTHKKKRRTRASQIFHQKKWVETPSFARRLYKNIGSPDFMVYNVTNNTFTVMDFYLDYILDLPGVKI